MNDTDNIIRFLKDMLPFWLCFSAMYIPFRLLTLKKPQRLLRELWLYGFFVSVILVLSQTVVPEPGTAFFADVFNREYYNFIPFHALKILIDLIRQNDYRYFLLINILGNIAVFVPIGFFFTAATGKKVYVGTLVGAGLSLFIELFQIIIPRNTDVDDLILNTLGAFIGSLCCALIVKAIKKKKEAKNG